MAIYSFCASPAVCRTFFAYLQKYMYFLRKFGLLEGSCKESFLAVYKRDGERKKALQNRVLQRREEDSVRICNNAKFRGRGYDP